MKVRTTASSLIIRETPGGADTGRRLKRGQVATSHGESWDQEWQYLTGPAGSGWASDRYLVVVPEAPPAPVQPARLLYSLEGEDPELTAKIAQLESLARAEGIEFTTADFGGVRTEADTAKIMKYRDDDYAVYVRNLKRTHPGRTPVAINTWRKIAPWGKSYHNYGAARDLRPTKFPPSFTASTALARLRVLARQVGLRTIQDDDPHVQLPITLAQAKARWLARTGGQ